MMLTYAISSTFRAVWRFARRRDIIPPAGSSYMVQVEHSDGAATEVFLFSGRRSEICFANHGEGGRFDAGWLHLPLAEVDDLIAMLRKEA
jgi:hypothetical protein